MSQQNFCVINMIVKIFGEECLDTLLRVRRRLSLFTNQLWIWQTSFIHDINEIFCIKYKMYFFRIISIYLCVGSTLPRYTIDLTYNRNQVCIIHPTDMHT